jgi:hypothetical protein
MAAAPTPGRQCAAMLDACAGTRHFTCSRCNVPLHVNGAAWAPHNLSSETITANLRGCRRFMLACGLFDQVSVERSEVSTVNARAVDRLTLAEQDGSSIAEARGCVQVVVISAIEALAWSPRAQRSNWRVDLIPGGMCRRPRAGPRRRRSGWWRGSRPCSCRLSRRRASSDARRSGAPQSVARGSAPRSKPG